MRIKKKLLLLLFILLPITITSSLYLYGIEGTKSSILKIFRTSLNEKNRLLIKKYLLPFREIEILRRHKYRTDATIENFQALLESKRISSIALENDMRLKRELSQLEFKSSEKLETLTDSHKFSTLRLRLQKYSPFNNVLLRGINNPIPVSAYLDHDENNIFLLSSIGVLAFAEENSKILQFKQIKNNINNFINEDQFNKTSLGHEEVVERLAFSMKDILVYDKKVFVSYTNEVRDNCWNTSILYGDLNFEEIIFKPLFAPKECVHSIDNPDKTFLALQSGGRIVNLDDDHILLSIGDYRNRYLAQKEDSIFGKIMKININDRSYNVFSMGSRNIQGLFYDKLNDYILFTEHGPKGGDEINLLYNEQHYKGSIPNFGWAISSYGGHYKKAVEKGAYTKYPLYKSHKKYGFIEPLKHFPPGTGISEIIGIDLEAKLYAFASMNDHGLYFISLDRNNKIRQMKRVSINERIRDLMLYNNKIYLFLEDTGSIGVINLYDLQSNI